MLTFAINENWPTTPLLHHKYTTSLVGYVTDVSAPDYETISAEAGCVNGYLRLVTQPPPPSIGLSFYYCHILYYCD